MKVRWNAGSIRLRITPTELQKVHDGEPVREELLLPGGVCWSAEVVPAEAETALQAAAGAVTLLLSRADAVRLAEPNREGVYFQSDGLRYYVEKDFPCVHPRAIDAQETPTESFPEPDGFRERKGVA